MLGFAPRPLLRSPALSVSQCLKIRAEQKKSADLLIFRKFEKIQ
jgi:hypothetical protein